jgi:dienelactone hydrolase
LTYERGSEGLCWQNEHKFVQLRGDNQRARRINGLLLREKASARISNSSLTNCTSFRWFAISNASLGPFLLRVACLQFSVLPALQHFAHELSRRRVVQVVVAYLVAVFAVLQCLDIMVTRLELPGVWMRWAVLLSLAGVPLTAVLSWLFDWTAAGVIRTKPPTAESQPRPTRRQAVAWWLALALLVCGIVWLAVRDHRYRTARAQLDEAVRLADQGKLFESLALAFKVEKAIPSASALRKLWPEISRVLTVETHPAGALVRAKPYGAPDSAFRTLGVTPFSDARITILPSQLRLEKDGFITAGRGLWRYGPFKIALSAELSPVGSVPDGMIAIPGGPMDSLGLVGLENVKPGEVPPAFVGKTEVTNAEYRKFVEDGGYRRRELWKEPFVESERALSFEEAMARFRDRTGRPGPSTWTGGDYPEGQKDFPVTGVSWYEAAAYAAWSGKSLPTIYHWARAATTWAAPDMVPRSNFGGTGPMRVGLNAGVSGYGLYDMAGNAKEWCWNADGPDRYILGGAYSEPIYMFNDVDAQLPLRREATFGFRVAQYPQPVRPELLAPLKRVIRDYSKEHPAGEEAFRIYAGFYGYDKTPLDSRSESTSETDRWRVERVSFNATYRGERMAALIFTPKSVPPPWQVVIYFPGSGALHSRSSVDVSSNSFNFIVKSGRALVYPIYKSTYERGDGLDSDVQTTSRDYRDHVLMWAQDLSRSLDYAETRRDLDTRRVAFCGWSWGGALGPLLAAIEPRIRAVVLVSGGLQVQSTLPEVDPFNFAPYVRQPTLMLNGRYDFFFPEETSQRPLFQWLGAPAQDKRQVVAEGGHWPPQELMVKETHRVARPLPWSRAVINAIYGARTVKTRGQFGNHMAANVRFRPRSNGYVSVSHRREKEISHGRVSWQTH